MVGAEQGMIFNISPVVVSLYKYCQDMEDDWGSRVHHNISIVTPPWFITPLSVTAISRTLSQSQRMKKMRNKNIYWLCLTTTSPHIHCPSGGTGGDSSAARSHKNRIISEFFDNGSDGSLVCREFNFRKLQPAVNFLVPHRTENSKLKVNPQLSKSDSSGVCEGSRRRRRGYFIYLSFYYLTLLFLLKNLFASQRRPGFIKIPQHLAVRYLNEGHP